MSFDYKLVVIPLIGGIIGYATNYIAVKMLFRPKNPLRLLFVTLQGVIPKRKKELALQVATAVETNLISADDIKDKITKLELGDEFKTLVASKVDNFVANKLLSFNPILAAFVTDDIKEKVKNIFMAELDDIFPDVFNMVAEKLDDSLDVSEIVAKKVNEFSTDDLEKIVLDIAAKELKTIEILGGILGVMIGGVQLLIITYL